MNGYRVNRGWLAPALTLTLVACAMSQSAFDRYAADIHERNEGRRRAAVEQLKKRGYVLLERDEDVRYATLEESALGRCRREDQDLDGGLLAPEEPLLRIQVVEAPPAGHPPKPPMVVTAPAEHTCAFLRQPGGTQVELEVKKEDGSTGRLVRALGPRSLARGPGSELFVVDWQPRVTKRKVLVKRTCNLMPVSPDPLERRRHESFGAYVFWAPAPRLRTVVVTPEQEDIDIECTDHVY